MIEQLAKQAGDSIWRKVGEKALVTAVKTVIEETVKASVELMKKAKLREQKAAFDDLRAHQKKASEPDEPDVDEQEEVDDDEQADVADSDDEAGQPDPKESPENAVPAVDFASFVAKQR